MDDNTIPSAVGDIHVPNKTGNNAPIDTSIEFTPQNPFTMDIPPKEGEDQGIGNPGYPVEPENTGVLRTALDEFKETSTTSHLLHWANRPMTQPASLQVQMLYPDVNDKFYHPAPPGWSPKQEIDKLSDTVDSRFMPKLMATKNPDDFNYTLDSINEEATRNKELQNGSTLGKILGGGLGLTLGSLENAIPIASIATKAKVGIGFLTAAFKSTPGILAAAAIHEGANQMDKVEGNLTDFIKDTFVDTAFGMAFFGVAGAAKTILNISEFGRLKQFARDSLDGIGFNYKVDKKGNLAGFEAVDTTGGGSASAAKVTRAQELADAAFYKGGIYKIPYVGEAAANIVSGNLGNLPGIKNVPWLRDSFNYVLGSPLVRLKTSDYPEANAFADSGFDHYITTVGEANGIVRPKSFEAKQKQTRAMLTDLNVMTTALHMERNGYSTASRPTIALQNAWSSIKQKSIETLSKETRSTDFISKPEFMDEVQRVVYSGETSKHAAVNDLAKEYRNVIDRTAKDYLKAYNLPEDYFRNMETHLSRVYDTQYMNDNEIGYNERREPTGWIPVISNYFKEADEVIAGRMAPIKNLESQLQEQKELHANLIKQPNITDSMVKQSSDKIEKLNTDLKYANEKLQNELRSNPEYDYHVDDRFALSADEAKELKTLTKPLDDLKAKASEQQKIVSKLKNQKAKSKSSSMKGKTVETAKKHAEAEAAHIESIKVEDDKLHELNMKIQDEEYNLYDQVRTGKINARLYNPLTFELRNPNERLKFRELFPNHRAREVMAKSAYDSIMNMHPEDIVSDIFGRMTGNAETNPLKKRTLMVPDKVLYDNNFMTKDIFAKTANYVNFLSRRTHLKTSFENVTVNGNFEELAQGLLARYQGRRDVINQKIDKLTSMLEGKEGKELISIQKDIKSEKKNLKTEAVNFNSIKKTMKTLFETRMMGIKKRDDITNAFIRGLMSMTAASNLHNLPGTQITDLGWGGFQHGIWPYIRDGIYPIMESLGGILKTKDAEALREMAPHVNLGYQDVGNNYADKNWHAELQPNINMGKIVNGIEKYAHFSALTDLSPYIDNGIQRAHGSVIQSRFMELLHKQVEGTLKPKEKLYLVKYGIDPKEWADRMVNSYKEAEGFKTKLGGYMSKSWQWQDLEAANVFNDAVFRGIQNTLVWKGMADSPFFADNLLGLFFHTFTGWTYAATNRYLIPSMQHADGELMLKMLWMMGAGALVSPMRRIARGDSPVPDDMSNGQRAYEVWQDSGVTSSFANVLAIANLMSSDKLLGNLKNDKYKNRMRTGIFGMSDVVSSTAGKVSDVLGMVNSGADEKDMKTLAHMLPISGAMYGHYIGDKIIESQGLPRNKRAAEFENR